MPLTPVPTLPGVEARTVSTGRLTTRVLFTGPELGQPVLFIHGNVSSATFWEDTLLALPDGFRGIAPDQRGYGEADPTVNIDATRGLGDLADDAIALLDALGLPAAHVVGHSLGGAVVWRLMADYASRILTATVVAPGSPYGFGGTRDTAGTPCYDDFAGSGGGVVNPQFAAALGNQDRSDAPGSPRDVLRTYYVRPPHTLAREEDLLSSMLSTRTGPSHYPGDSTPSGNWPGTAPGTVGPNNALSPRYAGDITALFTCDPKPPILWIRGADDQIVGDASLFEVGMLGSIGALPGWPGIAVFPPQPMIGQTRAVLDSYTMAGGTYQEVVIENCGHSPYLEHPDVFNAAFHRHLMSGA